MEVGVVSVRLAWMDALLSTPNDSDHGGIDAYARAVAFVLYRHMNPDGRARPGMRTLTVQAGVSPAVAVARVKVLEAAGWLSVERRQGAGSRYQATVPEGAVTAPTVSRDETVGVSPGETVGVSRDETVAARTVSSEPGTVSPGETEPVEPLTPTSSHSSTHVAPAGPGVATGRVRAPGSERRDGRRSALAARWTRHDWTQPLTGQPATRERIFDAMAARELVLAREDNRPGLPPAGSPREWAWLDEVAEGLRVEHEARALELRATRPGLPIEDFIWHLDRRLSAGGDPVMRAHTARYDQITAERRAAEAARTPDDVARDRAAARRCVSEIRAVLAARHDDAQIPA